MHILNLTRIIRNEQSSITSTLGVSFNKFLKEWKNYYVLGDKPLDNNSIQTSLEPEKNITQINQKLDLKPGEVDTDYYEFSIENIEKYKAQKSLVDKTPKIENTNLPKEMQSSSNANVKISAVKAYNNLLVANSSAVSIKIDPIRRFGVAYNATFNDLLENNIFKIDAFIKPSSPFFKTKVVF